jgi:predicted NUDIX family phosphoesterase
MNPEVLGAITRSVGSAVERYGSKFPKILSMDTSASRDVRESNAKLADNIVDSLEEFLNPEILVVPRDAIEKLPLDGGGSFNDTSVEAAVQCIHDHGKFIRRAEAEEDAQLVQIIPAAVLTSKDTVFVFQRKEGDPKSKLFGKTTVWQGTHVTRVGGHSGKVLLESALKDRIMRSLFLSREFATSLKGYCWDRDEPHSSKHFGVIFQVEIDNPHTASDLRKKEFRRARGRGHNLVGQFTEWGDLQKNADDMSLESWSRAILKGVSVFRKESGAT